MQSQNDMEKSDRTPYTNSVIKHSGYIRLLLKYRKLVTFVVGITFFISIIVCLIAPKVYVATARILPPHQNNQNLMSLLSNADNPLSGLAGAILDHQTPSTLYLGILKSRSVADALNKKFDLKKLYGVRYIEDVYEILKDRSTIEISKKDQIIIVSVEDRNPQRAADMANSYVELLDQTNRKLNITQGKRKRLFLEDRLKEVRVDLEQAEIALKLFQERYHLVSIEEQARVAIEGAAEIKSQIIAAQTELEVLKQFGTDKQVEAVMLKTKIEELQRQLESIEMGIDHTNSGENSAETIKDSNFYISFKDLPRLGLQFMRLTREAKIQENLFELLTAQYEMARIEEAKDVDTIQILDRAVEPEIHSNKSMFLVISFFVILSLIFSFMLIYLSEYLFSINFNYLEFFRKLSKKQINQ